MNQQSLLAHVFPELMNSKKQLTLNDVNDFLDKKVAEFVTNKDLRVVDIKPLEYGRLGPDNAGLRGRVKGHVKIVDKMSSILGINEFNSVRSDVCVYDGRWMYEVRLRSKGVMQLGWCTDQCRFNDENGVGDTLDSYGFDGNRIKLWNVLSRAYGETWEIGDVITCCIDLTETKLEYFRNGKSLGVAYDQLRVGPNIAYYPAFSLSQGDNVIVNFGDSKFIHAVEGYQPIQHQNKELLVRTQCLMNYWERLVPITVDCMKLSPSSGEGSGGDRPERVRLGEKPLRTSSPSSSSSSTTGSGGDVTGAISIQGCCWLIASNILDRLEPLLKEQFVCDSCLLPFLLKFCDTTNLSSRQYHVCLILDMIWSLFEKESAAVVIENIISGIVSLLEFTVLDVGLKAQARYLHMILAIVKHHQTKLFILEHLLFERFSLPSVMHVREPDDDLLHQVAPGDYWGYPLCVPEQCSRHRALAGLATLRPEFGDVQLRAQYTQAVHRVQIRLRELEDIQTEILIQLLSSAGFVDQDIDLTLRTIFLQQLYNFLRNNLNNADYVSKYNTSMLMSLFHRIVNVTRHLWNSTSTKYSDLPQFEDLSVPVLLYAMPSNHVIQLNSPRLAGRLSQLSKNFRSDIEVLLNRSVSSSSSSKKNNSEKKSGGGFLGFKRGSDFSKFLLDPKGRKNKPVGTMQGILLEERHASILAAYPHPGSAGSSAEVVTPLCPAAGIDNAPTVPPLPPVPSIPAAPTSIIDRSSPLPTTVTVPGPASVATTNSGTSTVSSSSSGGSGSGSGGSGGGGGGGMTFLPIRVEPLSLFTGLIGGTFRASGGGSTQHHFHHHHHHHHHHHTVSGAVGSTFMLGDTGEDVLSSGNSAVCSPIDCTMGSLTSTLLTVEAATVLYHIAANDHFVKLAAQRNQAHNLMLAIMDLSDRIRRVPEEEAKLKILLQQSLVTCEQKLTKVTRKLVFYNATEFSEEKRANILWLWTTILATMDDAKLDKLYGFVPTYQLEICMNIFRHLAHIFHPTLELEGLRECSTVLGLHGQTLMHSYRDRRITQSSLRSPIVKALAEFLQLPLALRCLELRFSSASGGGASSVAGHTALLQQTETLAGFLQALLTDWTDSMILLEKFWRGNGFAFRYLDLPHQTSPEFHLRDAVAKVMEKPNPSKFFQVQLKQLLRENQPISTGFIDLVLTKINWSFSEVVSNMQELHQHRGTRLDRLADIRYIRTCSLCFDITVSLLRILEMTVSLIPELFVDPARPNSELFLNRLFSSISQIFNRCINKGLFHNIINLKINGLEQIDYFPIITASLGVLLALVLDSPKKFPKTSSVRLVETMVRESNFLQQTFDRIICCPDSAPEVPTTSSSVQSESTSSNVTSTPRFEFNVCQYPDHIDAAETQRVRQFLDLIKSESGNVATKLSEQDDDICTICYAHLKNTVFKPCGHSSCKNCIAYQMMANPICFFCKTDIRKVEDLTGKDLHIKPHRASHS